MKPKIYIISGLGADERVFQLLDLSAYEVIYIRWILPEQNESIEHYAERLLPQITSPKPIIIGLSFGGMMAIEISKFIATEKIILLSSAKTKHEIPYYLRFLGFFGIDKLVPVAVLRQSNFIVNWFFGVKRNFEKQLLKQVLKEMNPVFLKWAIHKVLRWQNTFIPQNLYHLHGKSDHLLPIRFVQANEQIANGGHFMVLSDSGVVSARLNELLQH